MRATPEPDETRPRVSKQNTATHTLASLPRPPGDSGISTPTRDRPLLEMASQDRATRAVNCYGPTGVPLFPSSAAARGFLKSRRRVDIHSENFKRPSSTRPS